MYLKIFKQLIFAQCSVTTKLSVFDGWYGTIVVGLYRALSPPLLSAYRRRSSSESMLMLTRSPESVCGERQILSGRCRRELLVDEW